MPQRGQITTLQQRVEIGERAKAGESDAQIAATLGLSVWTVRKWRRKEHKEGRIGLASRPGRPPTGALGAAPPVVREAVHTLRKQYPGWGPQTLRVELEDDPQLAGQPLPSRSRIAAFLRQKKLARPYEHHTELAQPSPVIAHTAHEEWELDAQGVVTVNGLGRVSLIDIGDTFSRLKVECWPCVDSTKPTTEDYQLACRRAFLRYGLPQRITLDHDSAFYDNTCASPFPSRFHLWLIGLGVEVRFIQQPPPADHAFIERTHQLMTQQALAGQTFTDAAACHQATTARRDFLNRRYPSRSLQGRAPLEAHPEASHSGREYDPYDEAAQFDLARVHAYLASHRWFRQVSAQGQFSLGAHRYGVGKAWANQTVEITFDPTQQVFVCRSEDGQHTLQLPAQGLTKVDLLGELPPWEKLPAYQRRLPLSPAAWRENILYQEMAGTIL